MRIRPLHLLSASALLSLLAFLPSFDNCFQGDDLIALRILLQHNLGEAAFIPSRLFPFYRPAAVAQFGGQLALFGLHSGLFLATNWALHLAACLLLYRVARAIGLERWPSALASSLVLVGFAHYGKMLFWATCGPAILSQVLLLVVLWLAHRRPLTRGDAFALGALLLIAPAFHDLGKLAPYLLLLTIALRRGATALRSGRLLAATLIPAAAWLVLVRLLHSYYPKYGWIVAPDLSILDRFVRFHGLFLLPVQASGFSHSVLGRFAALTGVMTRVHYVIGGLVLLGGGLLWIRGPRVMRLFLAWSTFLLLFIAYVPEETTWLELRYLYFAAFPLAAVTAWMLARLHAARARWAPVAAVGFAVFLAVGSNVVVRVLERRYESMRHDPPTISALEEIRRLHEARR